MLQLVRWVGLVQRRFLTVLLCPVRFADGSENRLIDVFRETIRSSTPQEISRLEKCNSTVHGFSVTNENMMLQLSQNMVEA